MLSTISIASNEEFSSFFGSLSIYGGIWTIPVLALVVGLTVLGGYLIIDFSAIEGVIS